MIENKSKLWFSSKLGSASRGALILFGVSIAVRLVGLKTRPLWGDEILSLRDARQLGRTWNGILYFVVLKQVLSLTSDAFWLRLPAVVMGALATIPFFYCLRRLAGERAAWLGGALYALSPFAVAYSQEIRFYGLYLLAGASAFFLLVWVAERLSWLRLLGLAGGFVLLVASHFLGTLAVAGHALTLVWQFSSKRHRTTLLLSFGAAVLALLGMQLFCPELTSEAYRFVQHRVGGTEDATYSGPRGFSVALLAKFFFAFYFFAVGESIHPLDLPLSGLSAAFIGYLLLRGLVRSYRATPLMWVCTWTLLVLPAVLLFFVLDFLAPPDAGLAAPKYIAFASFPFIGLVTLGVLAHQRMARYAVGLGAVAVSVVGLFAHFRGEWSYNSHKLTDWPAAVSLISGWAGQDAILVADGRSLGELSYYLPEWPRERLLQLDTFLKDAVPPNAAHLLVLAYPARLSVLREYNERLQELPARWTPTDGFYQNGLTLIRYELDRPREGVWPRVLMPYDLVDDKYLDLKLPRQVSYQGRQWQVSGGFSLSAVERLRRRIMRVELGERACSELLVISNASELSQLPQGSLVAEIEVRGEDGAADILFLRMGVETEDWTRASRSAECETVHRWTKLAQLRGNQRTTTSWQQFEAHWFATRLSMPHVRHPVALTIRYLPEFGELHIWGLRMAS